MRIYNTTNGIIVQREQDFYLAPSANWDSFVNRSELFKKVEQELGGLIPDSSLQVFTHKNLLAPIGNQEVWASGVTYMRSREARMEESQDAGGGDFYARVYDAERPELFFKSPSYRVAAPGGQVRIRKDSNWNVPEPELTLFLCSAGTIEGYTIGNDMSSRDIEGENPLYLPQAKSYDGAAALGPCLYVPGAPIGEDASIAIEIWREGNSVFAGEISINRMKRTHLELAEYLFRETSFPYGSYLMTGTGIVPPDDFTLSSGDEIKITIEAIGTLVNFVK